MANHFIHWVFLNEIDGPAIANPTSSPSTQNHNPSRHQNLFVESVNNVCDIHVSQLPKSCIKGDIFTIIILEEEYQLEVEYYKNNLHGRIIWPKGTSPFSVVALKSKLANFWSSIGKQGTYLGKGYYEFSFSSIENVRKIRSINSWNLNPTLLKRFPWSKDFYPSNIEQTSS